MVIHEKGPKAERDRANGLGRYLEMCRLAGKRPESIAKYSNRELFRLGEDLWNQIPVKKQRAYLEDRNLIPRANPLAFKWFVRDRVRFFQATGWRWLVVMIMSPVRYPGFLLRSRKGAR